MSFSYENIFLHLMRTKANKERNITIPRGQSSRCPDWLEGFQGYDNRLGFNYTIYNHILEDLGQWDLFDLLLNMRQATFVSNR